MDAKKIDYAKTLFEKRDYLIREYNDIKPIILQLYSQPMDKFSYLQKHKVAAGLRTGSNILFFVDIIVFIYGIIRMFGTLYLDLKPIGFAVVLLFVSAIMGTVASSKRKEAYSNYIMQDAEFKRQNESKKSDYDRIVTSLQNIEYSLNDPKVSIVPQIYWNDADMILGAVKNGMYDSVGDAVRAMGIRPAANDKVCPKCSQANYNSLVFCAHCGNIM